MKGPGAVSVIIPARNASRWIDDQLESLSQQVCESPFEVVVVDNASDDDTARRVRSWSGRVPGLRVVEADDRATSGYARNRGAAAARHELLAFCDADDVVGPHWVAAQAQALTEHELVTGPVELTRLNEPWQVEERAGGWPDGPPIGNGFLPFAMTCNLGTRCAVLDELGGFDEVRTNGNDKVFSWDAQLAGHSLHFAPDAVVHYRLRSGSRLTWRRQLAIGRSAPSLYRRYRHHGMPASGLTGVARDMVALAVGLLRLGRPAGRQRWARVAGRRVGRIVGSVEHRTWYP